MFTQEFEKTSGRTAATVIGALGWPGALLSGTAAEEGKGAQTSGGAFAGNFAGGIAGLLAARGRHMGPAIIGGLGGGALGAYLAHGKDKKKELNTEA